MRNDKVTGLDDESFIEKAEDAAVRKLINVAPIVIDEDRETSVRQVGIDGIEPNVG